MAIFTRYEALRKEIKQLVAENEELKQLVVLLRENQELKSVLREQFNERNLLPTFESTRVDQQDPLINQAFCNASTWDQSQSTQLSLRQRHPSTLTANVATQFPSPPPRAANTTVTMSQRGGSTFSYPAGSAGPSSPASSASCPSFAAPATSPDSLQSAGPRGYCYECFVPCHPHRALLANGANSRVFPLEPPTDWSLPGTQHLPQATSVFVRGSPPIFPTVGFSQASPANCQAPPLSVSWSARSVGGRPFNAAQVQARLSIFPGPQQRGFCPPAPPQPHARPFVLQQPPPPPGKAKPPLPRGPAEPPGASPREGEGSAAPESATKTGSHGKAKEANKRERIVGEIAFQLDRRILSSIFPDRVRLYGFTILNIPEKISPKGNDPFLQLSPEQSAAITDRYNAVMNSLKPLGYDPSLHPKLSEHTVNTFGILRERPEASSPEAAAFSNLEHLEEVVRSVAPAEMLSDCLLFLRCLHKLSQEDRKPLFIW